MGYGLPLYYGVLISLTIFYLLSLFSAKKSNVFIEYLKYSFWLMIPVVLTPFAHDLSKHITTIGIIACSIFVSVIYVNNGCCDLRNFRSWNLLVGIWAYSNVFLLILYSFGLNFGAGVDFSGVADNRNFLSTATCLLLAVKLYFGVNRNKHDLLVLLLMVVVVLATGSSKGVLGVAFVFFGYFIANLDRIKIRSSGVISLLFVLISIPIVYLFVDQLILNSMARIFAKFGFFQVFDVDSRVEELAVLSQLARDDLYLQAISLVGDNLLSGLGFGGSELYITAHGGLHMYSHINHLELILSAGVFVVPLFYCHYAIVLISVLSDRRFYMDLGVRYACLLLVLILIFGLAMVSYTNLIFWLVYVSCCSYIYKKIKLLKL